MNTVCQTDEDDEYSLYYDVLDQIKISNKNSVVA